MKIKFLIALCSAVSICVEVYADGEQDVKRGTYPYMAFLYYPDESVVDGTGSRFVRGAILIRSDWLVTSAVGPSIVPGAPNGFPRKTLLARLGAVAIDVVFTLNEDEDEQEREVIQIVRPYNHSATQWWRTDISLMKVLLPFNITSAVDTIGLNYKLSIPEKTCIILVYAKKEGNTTEDRSLMQIRVEMLPPGNLNCGSHYTGNTMTCAADSDENKNAVYDPNFCQGNSGGPLICENEVVGLQTYIDNDCKQPHLYQLLSAWENFITCGIEDKCQDEQCSKICDVINKDLLITTLVTTETAETFPETSKISSETMEASSEATEASSEKSKATLTTAEASTEPNTTPVAPDTIDENEISTMAPTTSVKSEEVTTANIRSSVNDTITSQSVSEGEANEARLWPNEKDPDGRKSIGEGEVDSNGRKPAVQARRHKPLTHSSDLDGRKSIEEGEVDSNGRKPAVQSRRQKPVSYSTDSSNTSHLSMCLSIFYGFLIILACLI